MNAITGDLGRKYNGNSVTAQLDRKTVPEETSHLQVHIGQSSWINHPQLSRTSWVRSRTFNLMELGSAAKQSTQTHTHCLFSAITQETSGQQRQVTCDFVDKSHTFNCQCFSNITQKNQISFNWRIFNVLTSHLHHVAHTPQWVLSSQREWSYISFQPHFKSLFLKMSKSLNFCKVFEQAKAIDNIWGWVVIFS